MPLYQHNAAPGDNGSLPGNFARDVKDAVWGFFPGIAELARIGYNDAIRAATGPGGGRTFKSDDLLRGLKDYYQHDSAWAPLVHGDFGEAYSRFHEHPLGPVLDAGAVLSGGGALAGKAGIEAAKAGEMARLAALRTGASPEQALAAARRAEAWGLKSETGGRIAGLKANEHGTFASELDLGGGLTKIEPNFRHRQLTLSKPHEFEGRSQFAAVPGEKAPVQVVRTEAGPIEGRAFSANPYRRTLQQLGERISATAPGGMPVIGMDRRAGRWARKNWVRNDRNEHMRAKNNLGLALAALSSDKERTASVLHARDIARQAELDKALERINDPHTVPEAREVYKASASVLHDDRSFLDKTAEAGIAFRFDDQLPDQLRKLAEQRGWDDVQRSELHSIANEVAGLNGQHVSAAQRAQIAQRLQAVADTHLTPEVRAARLSVGRIGELLQKLPLTDQGNVRVFLRRLDREVSAGRVLGAHRDELRRYFVDQAVQGEHATLAHAAGPAGERAAAANKLLKQIAAVEKGNKNAWPQLVKLVSGQIDSGFASPELEEFLRRALQQRNASGMAPTTWKQQQRALRRHAERELAQATPTLDAAQASLGQLHGVLPGLLEQWGADAAKLERSHRVRAGDRLQQFIDAKAWQQAVSQDTGEAFVRAIHKQASRTLEAAQVAAHGADGMPGALKRIETQLTQVEPGSEQARRLQQSIDNIHQHIADLTALRDRLAAPVEQQRLVPTQVFSDARIAESRRHAGQVERGVENGLQQNAPAYGTVNGQRVVVLGDLTPEQWVERIMVLMPDPAMRAHMASWYEAIAPLFQDIFGEDAQAIMRAFAVSQANASPTSGLQNVFRVADRIRRGEEISVGEISTVAKSIEAALKGDPIEQGVAAKLSDFIDSIAGSPTRTWVGHALEGGSPVAVDVHALRDMGYVDAKQIERLRSRFGLEPGRDYQIDSTGGAADMKYEQVRLQYQDLTDHLNAIGFDGRKNWTPAEVQALGWSGIQMLHGVVPEDLPYAIERNTRRISAELAFGTGSPLAKRFGKRWEKLDYAQRQAATEQVISALLDELRPTFTPGVAIQKVQYGVGMYEGQVSPAVFIDIVGSAESVVSLSDALGYLLQQDEVWAARKVFSPKTADKIAGDVKSVRGAEIVIPDAQPGELARFVEELRKEKAIVGLQELPDQGGVRILEHPEYPWSPQERQAIESAVSAAAERAKVGGEANYDVKFELRRSVHDWQADPAGNNYLDSLQREGSDAVERVRALGATVPERVEAALADAAAGRAGGRAAQAVGAAADKPPISAARLAAAATIDERKALLAQLRDGLGLQPILDKRSLSFEDLPRLQERIGVLQDPEIQALLENPSEQLLAASAALRQMMEKTRGFAGIDPALQQARGEAIMRYFHGADWQPPEGWQAPYFSHVDQLREPSAGDPARPAKNPRVPGELRKTDLKNIMNGIDSLDPAELMKTFDRVYAFTEKRRRFNHIVENYAHAIPIGEFDPERFPPSRWTVLNTSPELTRHAQHIEAWMRTHGERMAKEMPELLSELKRLSALDFTSGERLYVLPKRFANELIGEYRSVAAFLRFFDDATTVMKASMLTLKPSWVVANALGQATLLGLASNPLSAARALAMQRGPLGKMIDEYLPGLQQATWEADMTPLAVFRAKHLPQDAKARALRTSLGALRNKAISGGDFVMKWNSILTDDLPRRARVLQLLEKDVAEVKRWQKEHYGRDVSDEEAARALLQNKQITDRYVETALNDLLDFSTLSDFEREWVRRAVPFWNWLKGITKRTAELGVLQPERMAQINAVSQLGLNATERDLGEQIPEHLRAAVVLGHRKDGRPIIWTTNSTNPLATVADMVDIGAGLVGLEAPTTAGATPLATVSPILKAPIEAMMNRDAFLGAPIYRDTDTGIKAAFTKPVLGRWLYQTVMPLPQPRLGQSLYREFQPPPAYPTMYDRSFAEALAGYFLTPVKTANPAVLQKRYQDEQRGGGSFE